MAEQTNFNDDAPVRNRRFLAYLSRVESKGSAVKQILHLAESIEADGIIEACKEHMRSSLSTIPEEEA